MLAVRTVAFRLSALMARWLLERRISEGSERLKRLRDELAVIDEQLVLGFFQRLDGQHQIGARL